MIWKAFWIPLLTFGLSFSNYYFDYFMCRYLSDRPKEAKLYCLQAIEEKPSPSLYRDVVRLLVSLGERKKAEELT